MSATFEIEGTLDGLVPSRGHEEERVQDAYLRGSDGGARLRVRLSSPELIEAARAALGCRVVVTGALVPAGVHQGPRMVEVTLPVAHTLAPAAAAAHDVDQGCADEKGSAPVDPWLDANELLAFMEREGVELATLTPRRLGRLVCECAMDSPNVAARLGKMSREGALAHLEATLISDPWFEHALAELLTHLEMSEHEQ